MNPLTQNVKSVLSLVHNIRGGGCIHVYGEQLHVYTVLKIWKAMPKNFFADSEAVLYKHDYFHFPLQSGSLKDKTHR